MLYKRTIPVTIEFYYEPEELSTEDDPGLEEYFELRKFLLGKKDVATMVTYEMETEILKFLKENKDAN